MNAIYCNLLSFFSPLSGGLLRQNSEGQWRRGITFWTGIVGTVLIQGHEGGSVLDPGPMPKSSYHTSHFNHHWVICRRASILVIVILGGGGGGQNLHQSRISLQFPAGPSQRYPGTLRCRHQDLGEVQVIKEGAWALMSSQACRGSIGCLGWIH